MVNIVFTPEEAKNCLAFLSRVDMKGHEAPAHNAVTSKIVAGLNQQNAQPKPTVEEEKDV